MTLAEDLMPVVLEGRGIAGELGFRPYTVAACTDYYANNDGSEWAGPGSVPLTEANNQPPRVKFLKDEDVPLGSVAPDLIEVGPLTPIGVTLEILEAWAVPVENGETRHLLITGADMPEGKRYRVLNIDRSKPLRAMIRAQGEEQALQAYGG